MAKHNTIPISSSYPFSTDGGKGRRGAILLHPAAPGDPT